MTANVHYEIAIVPTFLEATRELTPVLQAAVLDAIDKLRRGLHVKLHALHGVKWVSFAVNTDALRVICARDASQLILAHVGPHDAAYTWAARHELKQVGHAVRILNVADGDARDAPRDDATTTPRASAADGAQLERPPGPLAALKDKHLRPFGVDAHLAAWLRMVPDEDALLSLCARLDAPLGEALLSLADDPDHIADALAAYQRAKDAAQATVSLAEALASSVNAGAAWVAPPDQRALEAALAADSESWRVFLHPSQRRIVDAKASGPMLVTGGPGTGKTVVALHRARVLAERSAQKPVLATTFSRVLCAQLADGVRMVCRDAPALEERIVVRTLAETAREVLRAAAKPHALLTSEDIDAAWAEALVDGEGRGRKFYASEREQVVLARGVADEDAYLHVSRAGRGERLDRAEKRKVWAVLARFEAALARRGGDDAAGLARRATALLASGTAASPYAGVVCDEVQDAGPAELRLLAALAPVELFLVGDGHQRLYERPTSLRACGIEVRGRSSRLKLNYRTTQGICAAALEALEGVDADVLDVEATDAGASEPDGYRSVRAGERPQRRVFESADAEAAFIASEIRATTKRPFLVLARTKRTLSALADKLRARGVTCAQLEDTDGMPAGEHVVLATLHRSKGLEAPRVILAAMHEVPATFPGGTDEDKALWMRKERLLVYVGMTRARDACTLTAVAREAPRA